jgi:hypothetical protein
MGTDQTREEEAAKERTERHEVHVFNFMKAASLVANSNLFEDFCLEGAKLLYADWACAFFLL